MIFCVGVCLPSSWTNTRNYFAVISPLLKFIIEVHVTFYKSNHHPLANFIPFTYYFRFPPAKNQSSTCQSQVGHNRTSGKCHYEVYEFEWSLAFINSMASQVNRKGFFCAFHHQNLYNTPDTTDLQCYQQSFQLLAF